jgi:Domain of unknown function (DUF4111)
VLSVALKVAEDLLARVDRVAPGWVEGFYLVGSASLGAFRPGMSDLDFVAVVSGELTAKDLMRLRAVHLGQWLSASARDVALHWRWPLVCNGIYLRRGDLALPAATVTPIAGHVAARFSAAERSGFDANPVTWHTLASHGIAIRGPGPERLQIHLDTDELRAWSLANLNDYWRRWSKRSISVRALPRRAATGGVLGAPRLQYTIATGKITTKESAGEYALEVFDRRWHPLIKDALAFWRGHPAPRTYRRHPIRRQRDASRFVEVVIDAANELPFGSRVPRSDPLT